MKRKAPGPNRWCQSTPSPTPGNPLAISCPSQPPRAENTLPRHLARNYDRLADFTVVLHPDVFEHVNPRTLRNVFLALRLGTFTLSGNDETWYQCAAEQTDALSTLIDELDYSSMRSISKDKGHGVQVPVTLAPLHVRDPKDIEEKSRLRPSRARYASSNCTEARA